MGKTICYKCGSILPDGSFRCPNCGAPAPLTDEEIASTSSRAYRAGAVPVPAAPPAAPRHEPLPVADGISTGTDEESVETVAINKRPEREVPPIQPQAPAPPKSMPNPAPRNARPNSKPERTVKPLARQVSAQKDFTVRQAVLIALAAALVIGVGIALYCMFHQEDTGMKLYALATAQMYGAPDENSAAVGIVHEGSEVQVVGRAGRWFKVRHGDSDEMYVPSANLVDESTLYLLDRIMYDSRSYAALPEAAYRRALIDYFRNNLTEDERLLWRLKVSPSETGATEVLINDIFNSEPGHEDLAIVLTDWGSGQHRFIYLIDTGMGYSVIDERPVPPHSYRIRNVTADDSQPSGLNVVFE